MLKGYTFNRIESPFKNYINKIYDIKSNPINNTQKSMAKSLLNNLLGRFGIRLDTPVTTIMSHKSFDLISLIREVVSYKTIGDDKILVSYLPKLDKSLIDGHNMDISKVANLYKDEESTSRGVTSVIISAAVTAYGRVEISKVKLEILARGGNLYYSDTDSIVTDMKLPEDIVSKNELGKFKLEHVIEKGIFISGKTYAFFNKQGEFINRAKGVSSKSLSFSDYLKMLWNLDVNATKTQSVTN